VTSIIVDISTIEAWTVYEDIQQLPLRFPISRSIGGRSHYAAKLLSVISLAFGRSDSHRSAYGLNQCAVSRR
jgi:hypothetical protein